MSQETPPTGPAPEIGIIARLTSAIDYLTQRLKEAECRPMIVDPMSHTWKGASATREEYLEAINRALQAEVERLNNKPDLSGEVVNMRGEREYFLKEVERLNKGIQEQKDFIGGMRETLNQTCEERDKMRRMVEILTAKPGDRVTITKESQHLTPEEVAIMARYSESQKPA